MSILTIPEPPRRRRARTALGLGLGLGGALAFLAARRASAPWPAVLGARGAVSLLYAALGLDDDETSDYSTVVAACAAYDDDSHAWDCGHADFMAWCREPDTYEGTRFASVCSAACPTDSGDPTAYSPNATYYALVCTWEAVAALPDACAGGFEPTAPGSAAWAAPGGARENDVSQDVFDALDVYACDEHAFCRTCGEDNPYCAAVAAYYGGVGAEYPCDFGTDDWRCPYTWDSGGLVGANAAARAVDLDLELWCADDTLAAIAAGTFDAVAARRRRLGADSGRMARALEFSYRYSALG